MRSTPTSTDIICSNNPVAEGTINAIDNSSTATETNYRVNTVEYWGWEQRFSFTRFLDAEI